MHGIREIQTAAARPARQVGRRSHYTQPLVEERWRRLRGE